MLSPQGDRRFPEGGSFRAVYVGDGTRGASAAEELPHAEVETIRRGVTALDRLESAEVDCVVAESSLPDADGAEFLDAVGDLYPSAVRVLVADTVDRASGDVGFVPTRPAADLPARIARRVERAIERRAAERERDRLADRFDRLVEGSPDAILTIDEECRVVFANEAIEQVFGWNPESVVGGSATKLLEESVHDRFEETVAELVDDEGTVDRDYVELPGEHRDGHTVPLAISFHETERGGRHFFSAIVRDVSERKRLEDNLAAEKRKTRELHEVAVMLEECETAAAVYRLAVEAAEQLLEFDLCAVDTVEDGELVPRAVSEGVPTDGYYTTTPLSAEDDLAVRAYRRGESLQTYDRRAETVDPAAAGYRAALSVPVGDIGVFQAVSEETGAFDGSDRELAELLVSHVAQALKRIRSEAALAAERDRFAALFENISEPTVDYELVDGRCIVRSVNQAFEDVFGYEEDDVVGTALDDLIVPEAHQSQVDEHVELVRHGEPIDAEVRRETADGEREFILRNAEISDREPEGYLIYTDITEHKEYEEMLDALHGATRDLIAAEHQRDICETAVETAHDVLDIPHATVFRWNDERGALEPYVTPEETVDAIGEPPTFERGEGIVGSVFEAGDAEVFEDAQRDPRALEDGSSGIRGYGVFPLGEWGVLNVASLSVGQFDPYEIDLVRVLAANTEVALNRAAREAELADQRCRLAQLDRINEVIRDVDQLLVRASTREEILQAVCDRLAGSDHYRFAWTGETMAGGTGLEPTARAGFDEGYLEAVLEAGEEPPRGPADDALDTAAVCVVQNVRESPTFDPWREEAIERGFESAAAIPLRYGETVYGVLCVYADRADAFDTREQAVLEELGETIGHAINAAENKRALVSDDAVEVEFEIRDGTGFFARVPRKEGGAFALEGVTMTADGSFVYFMTVSGVAPDRVRELAEDADDVTRARLVNEHDDGHLFEFVYTGPSPLQRLVDHGGTIRNATFAEDGGRTVVELPRNVDVRSVVESIERSVPGMEVRARRERERPEQTVEEFRTALEDDLTDRQRSALEAAYLAGFFEWPRESNGEEVSASLGVSAPTFHQHLRVGERKLLAAFLDD